MITKLASQLEQGDMVVMMVPSGPNGYDLPNMMVVDSTGIEHNLSRQSSQLYFTYYDVQGDTFLRVQFERDMKVHVIGKYDKGTKVATYYNKEGSEQPIAAAGSDHAAPPVVAGDRRIIDIKNGVSVSTVKRQLVIWYDGTQEDPNEMIYMTNNLSIDLKGRATDIMDNIETELNADLHIVTEVCYRIIKDGATNGIWKDYQKIKEVHHTLDKLWQ